MGNKLPTKTLEEPPNKLPNKSSNDVSQHVLYDLSNDEFQMMRNVKSKFGKNYAKYERNIDIPFKCDITNFRGRRISVPIQNYGKSFNNLKLVLKLSNDNEINKKINIGNLLNDIDLLCGGSLIDRINGNFIEPLLKMNNMSYTQIDQMIIIPLPFDIVSNELCIVNELSKWFDKRLEINFADDYDIIDVQLFATFYEYDNIIKLDDNLLKYYSKLDPFEHEIKNINSKFINLIKINQQNHYTYNLTKNEYSLNFNHPLTDIYFYFIDDDNNIIYDKLFDSCSLLINDCNVVEHSYISLMHETKQKFENINGYYYFPIENLKYDNPNKKSYKYSNFSCLKSSIKFTNENYQHHDKNITLVICSIGYNVFGYCDYTTRYFYTN